jgi:RHS repeat-associated protein
VTRPGSYIDYTYNARNWITAVHNRLTGGATMYDADYYYSDGALWDHTGNPLKRVENSGASDFTTTLRYDSVSRQTEETKRDSGSNLVYTLGYGYDAVGNRISETRDGQALSFTYDDNNKLTYVSATSPTASATMAYDDAGNMTSVSGTLYENKTMVFNDDDRVTSIAYGGVTDTYTYNWEGQRTRAYLAGTYHRYLYHGERVLQDLNDYGDVQTCYTLEDGSYSGSLLIINFPSSNIPRFPLYDEIGSARGLVDSSGTVTDSYDMDTFGTELGSTGSTPNPYRYGAAWGYITDPSGLLQLGARFYWPEVGRFVSQDPERDDESWYVYVADDPVSSIDPTGLKKLPPDWMKPCRDKLLRDRKRCGRNIRNDTLECAGGYWLCVRYTKSPHACLAFWLVCQFWRQVGLWNCLNDAWNDFFQCIEDEAGKPFVARHFPATR